MNRIPLDMCIRTAKNHPPFHYTETDDRYKESTAFESIAGFRFEEIKNLNHTIATFILPRLAYLRDAYTSEPVSSNLAQSWKDILDNMVDGFYQYVHKPMNDWTDEEHKTWQCAKSLFCMFFEDLWD